MSVTDTDTEKKNVVQVDIDETYFNTLLHVALGSSFSTYARLISVL